MAKEENKAILTLDGVEYDINKTEPESSILCIMLESPSVILI